MIAMRRSFSIFSSKRLPHLPHVQSGMKVKRFFCDKKDTPNDDYEHYEDLWDSHYLLNKGGWKYNVVLSSNKLSYIKEKENVEPETMGSVNLNDIFLINMRTTDWGPLGEDLFYDVYDSVSATLTGQGKPWYVPLIIAGSGKIDWVTAIHGSHGININVQNLNEGMLSVQKKNFPLYFNEALYKKTHQKLLHSTKEDRAEKATLTAEEEKGYTLEELLELDMYKERIEVSKRCHYLYRSFYNGESNALRYLKVSCTPCVHVTDPYEDIIIPAEQNISQTK